MAVSYKPGPGDTVMSSLLEPICVSLRPSAHQFPPCTHGEVWTNLPIHVLPNIPPIPAGDDSEILPVNFESQWHGVKGAPHSGELKVLLLPTRSGRFQYTARMHTVPTGEVFWAGGFGSNATVQVGTGHTRGRSGSGQSQGMAGSASTAAVQGCAPGSPHLLLVHLASSSSLEPLTSFHGTATCIASQLCTLRCGAGRGRGEEGSVTCHHARKHARSKNRRPSLPAPPHALPNGSHRHTLSADTDTRHALLSPSGGGTGREAECMMVYVLSLMACEMHARGEPVLVSSALVSLCLRQVSSGAPSSAGSVPLQGSLVSLLCSRSFLTRMVKRYVGEAGASRTAAALWGLPIACLQAGLQSAAGPTGEAERRSVVSPGHPLTTIAEGSRTADSSGSACTSASGSAGDTSASAQMLHTIAGTDAESSNSEAAHAFSASLRSIPAVLSSAASSAVGDEGACPDCLHADRQSASAACGAYTRLLPALLEWACGLPACAPPDPCLLELLVACIRCNEGVWQLASDTLMDELSWVMALGGVLPLSPCSHPSEPSLPVSPADSSAVRAYVQTAMSQLFMPLGVVGSAGGGPAQHHLQSKARVALPVLPGIDSGRHGHGQGSYFDLHSVETGLGLTHSKHGQSTGDMASSSSSSFSSSLVLPVAPALLRAHSASEGDGMCTAARAAADALTQAQAMAHAAEARLSAPVQRLRAAVVSRIADAITGRVSATVLLVRSALSREEGLPGAGGERGDKAGMGMGGADTTAVGAHVHVPSRQPALLSIKGGGSPTQPVCSAGTLPRSPDRHRGLLPSAPVRPPVPPSPLRPLSAIAHGHGGSAERPWSRPCTPGMEECEGGRGRAGEVDSPLPPCTSSPYSDPPSPCPSPPVTPLPAMRVARPVPGSMSPRPTEEGPGYARAKAAAHASTRARPLPPLSITGALPCKGEEWEVMLRTPNVGTTGTAIAVGGRPVPAAVTLPSPLPSIPLTSTSLRDTLSLLVSLVKEHNAAAYGPMEALVPPSRAHKGKGGEVPRVPAAALRAIPLHGPVSGASPPPLPLTIRTERDRDREGGSALLSNLALTVTLAPSPKHSTSSRHTSSSTIEGQGSQPGGVGMSPTNDPGRGIGGGGGTAFSSPSPSPRASTTSRWTEAGQRHGPIPAPAPPRPVLAGLTPALLALCTALVRLSSTTCPEYDTLLRASAAISAADEGAARLIMSRLLLGWPRSDADKQKSLLSFASSSLPYWLTGVGRAGGSALDVDGGRWGVTLPTAKVLFRRLTARVCLCVRNTHTSLANDAVVMCLPHPMATTSGSATQSAFGAALLHHPSSLVAVARALEANAGVVRKGQSAGCPLILVSFAAGARSLSAQADGYGQAGMREAGGAGGVLQEARGGVPDPPSPPAAPPAADESTLRPSNSLLSFSEGEGEDEEGEGGPEEGDGEDDLRTPRSGASGRSGVSAPWEWDFDFDRASFVSGESVSTHGSSMSRDSSWSGQSGAGVEGRPRSSSRGKGRRPAALDLSLAQPDSPQSSHPTTTGKPKPGSVGGRPVPAPTLEGEGGKAAHTRRPRHRLLHIPRKTRRLALACLALADSVKRAQAARVGEGGAVAPAAGGDGRGAGRPTMPLPGQGGRDGAATASPTLPAGGTGVAPPSPHVHTYRGPGHWSSTIRFNSGVALSALAAAPRDRLHGLGFPPSALSSPPFIASLRAYVSADRQARGLAPLRGEAREEGSRAVQGRRVGMGGGSGAWLQGKERGGRPPPLAPPSVQASPYPPYPSGPIPVVGASYSGYRPLPLPLPLAIRAPSGGGSSEGWVGGYLTCPGPSVSRQGPALGLSRPAGSEWAALYGARAGGQASPSSSSTGSAPWCGSPGSPSTGLARSIAPVGPHGWGRATVSEGKP